jgi:hypothetical protein
MLSSAKSLRVLDGVRTRGDMQRMVSMTSVMGLGCQERIQRGYSLLTSMSEAHTTAPRFPRS